MTANVKFCFISTARCSNLTREARLSAIDTLIACDYNLLRLWVEP
jgi:hypothetical protein